MSTYPMPACGYNEASRPITVHNLQTFRLGDTTLYGVANGNPKKVWTLEHSACTWTEWLAIDAHYEAEVVGGSATFDWYASGSIYSITGKWMSPPTVQPIDQYHFAVQSVIGT